MEDKQAIKSLKKAKKLLLQNKISKACSIVLPSKKLTFIFFEDASVQKKIKDIYINQTRMIFSTKFITTEHYIPWFSNVFSIFEEKLCFYIEIKKQIEFQILMGNGKVAIEKLDELDLRVGKSYWAEERRIIIEKVCYKKTWEESYINEILEDEHYNPLIKYPYTIIFDRITHESTSFSQIFETKKYFVSNLGKAFGISAFGMFYAKGLTNKELLEYIVFCSGQSLIDTYESAITFLHLNQKQEIVEDLAEFFMPNRIRYLDFRVKNTLILKDENILKNNHDYEEYQLNIDYYSGGRYKIVAENCLKQILNNGKIDYISLLIKSSVRLGNNEYIKKLAGSLKEICLNSYSMLSKKGLESDKAYEKLVSNSLVFNNFQIGTNISELLTEFSSNKLDSEDYSSLNKELLSFNDFERGVLATVNLQEIYLKYAQKGITNRIYKKKWIENNIEGCKGEIPSYRYFLIKLEYEVRMNIFDKANETVNLLEEMDLNRLDVIRLIRLKFKTFYRQQNFEQLILFLVDLYTENEDFFYFLDINFVLSQMYQNNLSVEKSKIETLLFLLAADNYGNKEFFVLLTQCLRIYVRKNKITNIFELLSRFELKYVKYFEMILKGDYLKFTRLCKTNEEQYDLKIESYLALEVKVDKDGLYGEEIKEVIDEKLLEKDIKNYNENKIYIDVKGILDTYKEDIKFQYQKTLEYKNVKRHHINFQNEQGSLVVIDYLENTIRNLFNTLLEEYTSNKKFGLKGSLSIGIKHGVLDSYVKGVLDKGHLLSTSANSNDKYPSGYWTSKYSLDLDPDKLVMLQEGISDFTEVVASILKKFINHNLKIITNTKESGGLAYSNLDNSIDKITSLIRKSEKYDLDDFINMFIEEFDELTDQHLTRIRSEDLKELENKLKAELNILLLLVKKISKEQALDSLKNSIVEAEKHIRDAFVVIEKWFYRNEGGSPWSEGRIIVKAILVAKTYHEKCTNIGTELTLSIDGEGSFRLKPKNTRNVIDVFFNLFQNTINYSGGMDKPEGITICLGRTTEGLLVEYKNGVSGSKEYLENIKSKIIEVKEKIENDKYLLSVDKEGGTGIPKVEKLLKYDLSGGGIKEIHLEDRVFHIKMLVPWECFEDEVLGC